mmetsp:Transcript_31168/g.70003  ORF Transcript_31168/g.70003 Transcript_31168/m.70003 type:complete len:102 (+) Transcript_31168:101-406(+)
MSMFGAILRRLVGSRAIQQPNRSVSLHSSVKKRFRVTSSGKVKRPQAGKSHNTGKHSRKMIRSRGEMTTIKCPKMERNMRKLLGGLTSKIKRIRLLDNKAR